MVPRIGGKGLANSSSSSTNEGLTQEIPPNRSKSLELCNSSITSKYSGLKVAELRAKLKSRGLNQAGILSELVIRLELHDKRKKIMKIM